jgi:hypothetical protein
MDHRPDGKRRSRTLSLGKVRNSSLSNPEQLDQAAAAPWERSTPADLAEGHSEALP